MLFSTKRMLYEALPGCLKAPVGWVPFSWVAGRPYRAAMRRGRGIDRPGSDEGSAWQERALGRMLRWAVDQVPAYAGLRSVVERLAPRDALREFPLLDKERLQTEMPNFLPREFERLPKYACSTGGTSGNQLKFYVDNDSHAIETAFMHRQWARVGYTPRCRKATFRGVTIQGVERGRLWQRNPIYNELQFSPFHMSDENLEAYWGELLRFRPQYLHGYPSAISLLVGFLRRSGKDTGRLPLRAVLLGSEGALPEQRNEIERVLQTRCFSWYGHSERVLLAGECERSSAYHHFPDYGALEVLSEEGRACGAGERGELVGTGLLNRVLPLIRYRTGDRARLLDSPCDCGRRFDRFDEVEGRWQQEFLVGRSGARISLAALNLHGPFFDRVRRYQYVQSEPGEMVVRILPADGFLPTDEASIRAAYQAKTGAELHVGTQVVAHIPLTPVGKVRRLVRE